MALTEPNFSKIVRSLLLDIDICLDHLVQIGYFTGEQRGFLDKYLYKSEDALIAANLVASSRDGNAIGSLSLKLQDNKPCETSESSDDAAATRAIPRLRGVTEALITEEIGLTNFLKRCNARNFSVQVRGPEVAKDSTSKGKGPEYVSALEPIAEAAAKASEGNVKVSISDKMVPEHVSHGSGMLLGVQSSKHDADVKSIDYGRTTSTDTATTLCSDEVKPAITDSIELTLVEGNNIEPAIIKPIIMEPSNTETVKDKPTDMEPSNAETIKTKAAGIDSTNLEPASITAPKFPAPKFSAPKFEPAKHEFANSEPADTGLTNKEQNRNSIEMNESSRPSTLVAQNTKKIKLNAWGKPVKPDPTRHEDGDIIGGSAKPLGANNKGRAMMEKMGWSKGSGLGKEKNGILEPITHKVKNTKSGLRSSAEEGPKDSSSSSESTSTAASAGAKALDSAEISTTGAAEGSDWEKAPELTPDQIRFAALWANAEKERQVLAANERRKPKPPFKGINALFIRESDDKSVTKKLSFSSKIQSTNEYKTTEHVPGLVVMALSAQPVEYAKSQDGKAFKVCNGHRLEVLRHHSGNDYEVYSFKEKLRAIVKISLLEIMEEPEARIANGVPWPTAPATIAA